MTATRQLAKRVSRLEPLDGGTVKVSPDFRALDDEARERLRVLLTAKLAGEGAQAMEAEIKTILMHCPWMVGTEKMLPPYLLGVLQTYWEKRLAEDQTSWSAVQPYNFYRLSFACRQRLTGLCQTYGWDLSADFIQIAPLEEWRPDDSAELSTILTEATPDCASVTGASDVLVADWEVVAD